MHMPTAHSSNVSQMICARAGMSFGSILKGFAAGTNGDNRLLMELLPPLLYWWHYRLTLCDPNEIFAQRIEVFSPIERANWGRAIHDLDPRSGVVIGKNGLPEISWCDVPSGQFIYQQNQ